MPPALLAKLDAVARLEPTRLGVRLASGPRREDSGGNAPAESLEMAELVAGSVRAGPCLLEVDLASRDAVATCRLRVRNVDEQPIELSSVLVGMRFSGELPGGLRFLQHGWQSWSFCGARQLHSEGDPAFPSGPWLRGMHHALPALPADRAGWHESHLVTVVGASPGGPCALVGLLERGESFGLVYLRRIQGGVELELEIRLETTLEPGAERVLEPVRMALGREPALLLEDYARALGAAAEARTRSPFQAGWCSWYHFFHDVTEADLLRNLDALVARRSELPIDVVQLDDGYQRAIGDWLETNEKFPSGLAPLAAAIREAGFTPGLWTAPFCVVPESRIFETHGDWLLRHGDALHLGLLHPEWTAGARVHTLDPTRDDVIAHLEETFAELGDMGFDYLQLDFLYAAAMQAAAHDPGVTRAQRLRRGLEAIRRGAGPDRFLLGCGCPLGPALGIVDGMRIGPDVAPSWDVPVAGRIPGIEDTQPSTRSAVRSILARAWMHRRLWLNDPDCLMARGRDTQLRPEEARTLASCIAASGGMVVFSDDVPELSPESLVLVRETLALARAVDGAADSEGPRALGLLEEEIPAGLTARTGEGALVALVNASDEPKHRRLDRLDLPYPAAVRLQDGLLFTEPTRSGDALELPPHTSALFRVAGDRLAVFCDFDGTFAVQDVGSSIARRYAGERRSALWKKLEQGKLSAWDYNLALLDRLPLPEEELAAFLESVELSLGASELVAWCTRHGVPFRILSDGFDYNLDRLQRIHGVHFAYDANHLHYEDGGWRIQASHPNPDCGCGTGTCKRGRIERFRAEHPDALIVHIGNGRVSDLCATDVVDVVFAKDSLAEELAARDVPLHAFETLQDVLPVLKGLRAADFGD
jgi:alpha-galactosidase